jgi:hypothetical protein
MGASYSRTALGVCIPSSSAMFCPLLGVDGAGVLHQAENMLHVPFLLFSACLRIRRVGNLVLCSRCTAFGLSSGADICRRQRLGADKKRLGAVAVVVLVVESIAR